MPVSHWRVRRLAREAGLDAESATLVLMEDGLDVSSPDHYIRRADVGRAREALRAYVEGPRTVYTPTFEWPRLRRESVEYLDVEFVEDIHGALTREFRDTEDAVFPEGVKDDGLLASAVMRPQVSASKYPNVAAAGAALVQSLIHNHPFHNGNKRTALLALVVFLEARNGRYLDFDEDAIYDLIVRIASHTLLQGDVPPRHEDPYFSDREVLAIYEWIVRHTSEPEIGDHRIRWGKLEEAPSSSRLRDRESRWESATPPKRRGVRLHWCAQCRGRTRRPRDSSHPPRVALRRGERI
jgi:death-on-curing family protein